MRDNVAQNRKPLVTIAIPTYNRANSYLPQALGSALDQTYSDIEIIVSDNCSTDNTAAVVGAVVDRRIQYFRQAKNIGANDNFNFCLEQARGDYFLLLHDDDMIDQDFVEACMEAANYRRDIGIIRTGTRLIDSQGTIIREVPNIVGGLTTEALFRGYFSNRTTFYLCSTLFNTTRLRETGGFQSKYQLLQDDFALVQLAARFGRVDAQQVKASFRTHPSEMVFSTRVAEWCDECLLLLSLMCNLLPENREQVRIEGMHFFANSSYGRARTVNPRLKRAIAYWTVFKKFNYRYLPSNKHLYAFFDGTPMHHAVRFLKRKVPRMVAHI